MAENNEQKIIQTDKLSNIRKIGNQVKSKPYKRIKYNFMSKKEIRWVHTGKNITIHFEALGEVLINCEWWWKFCSGRVFIRHEHKKHKDKNCGIRAITKKMWEIVNDCREDKEKKNNWILP